MPIKRFHHLVAAILFCTPLWACDEPSDQDVCGKPPRQCSWGAPPGNYDSSQCGSTQCGDWYECTCNRATESWSAIALDCFCSDPPSAEPCAPVAQTGCQDGEKCGQLVESSDPFLARTSCVPDGTMTEGQPCTQGEAGTATGYDNCSSGYHCSDNFCTRICSEVPDTCRSDDEGFGDGAYCTKHVGIFDALIGLCESACEPTNDSVASGVVSNASCAEGEGCYIDVRRGTAVCTPPVASESARGQNAACTFPTAGSCYSNGCEPGFAPQLSPTSEAPPPAVCARYCSPSETHIGAQALATGLDAMCSADALAAVGGTNGVSGEHQCRFVQSASSEAHTMNAGVGLCVPTAATSADWGNCRQFAWESIKSVWTGALAAGEDPQTAFDAFCLLDPANPETSPLRDACLGMMRGCISLEEREDGLPGFAL